MLLVRTACTILADNFKDLSPSLITGPKNVPLTTRKHQFYNCNNGYKIVANIENVTILQLLDVVKKTSSQKQLVAN
ncbi:hypothetical protein YC2023_109850 [Brassica napus]